MKTFRDTQPMTREASNAPQACPPCAGSCNQGRACPAQRQCDGSGATPFFLALMCVLVGLLGGSVLTLNWAPLMEWLREFA